MGGCHHSTNNRPEGILTSCTQRFPSIARGASAGYMVNPGYQSATSPCSRQRLPTARICCHYLRTLQSYRPCIYRLESLLWSMIQNLRYHYHSHSHYSPQNPIAHGFPGVDSDTATQEQTASIDFGILWYFTGNFKGSYRWNQLANRGGSSRGRSRRAEVV